MKRIDYRDRGEPVYRSRRPRRSGFGVPLEFEADPTAEPDGTSIDAGPDDGAGTNGAAPAGPAGDRPTLAANQLAAALAEPDGADDPDAAEPPAWQTPDGDRIYLPRHLLDQLILRLRRRRAVQPANLPRRRMAWRRPGWRPGTPVGWRPGVAARVARRPWLRPSPGARRAMTRRIGRLVHSAQRTGTLRHRASGQRLPVFQATSRGRRVRIVTRPRGRRLEIQLFRGGEMELEHQQDQELRTGADQELDLLQELELELEEETEQELGPKRSRRPLPRQGTGNLDAAWKGIQAASVSAPARGRTASAPRARAGAREIDLYEMGSAKGRTGGTMQLPKLQVKTSLPLPTYGPVPVGPLLVRVAPRITLKGTASLGRPGTTVALTPGKMQADFEAKVETSLGKVSLTGSVEPGKASKLGIKLGNEYLEIDFAAQVNLREPFVLSIKPNTPVQRVVKFGEWTFQGVIEPSVAVSFAPNPTWPGWATAARGTVSVARGVAAAGRGVFFAGKLATGTAVGAAAIGAGIALGGIGWVGFTLYMIGKAHEDGRARRMGMEFSNGYAGMLANFSSGQKVIPDTKAGRETYLGWLEFDWRVVVEKQGKLWIKNGDKDALWRIREAGSMAAVQDIALFIRLYGPHSWRALAAQHRAQYGNGDGARKQAYLRILYKQAKQGQPIGIPLVPPGP